MTSGYGPGSHRFVMEHDPEREEPFSLATYAERVCAEIMLEEAAMAPA